MSEIRVKYNSGRKEPVYRLEQEDKKCIFEVLSTSEKIGLNHISFKQQANSSRGDIHFYLNQCEVYWELVVKDDKGIVDIYKIGEDESIEYDRTEGE